QACRAVEHPLRQLKPTAGCVAIRTAAKDAAGSVLDHLMDMNNTPEPRIPPVENPQIHHLLGAITSACSTACARTLRSTRLFRSIDVRGQSGSSDPSLGSAVWIGTTFG